MAHFHPLESSPGTCLPSPFAGRCKKGRSVRQIPRHSHTPLIPFVCPSPCSHSPFSPALPPTSVSHSRMAHGSPGTCRDGWMDATLGFSSRNPSARSCRFAFSLPSLPTAKRGCWKTENGGARWEMQGSASSPAAGAEVPLGRSAGRSRSTGEGREGSNGQGCVGRVGQMPRHPSPQILPILCCSIPAGIHGELNPIVLGASCHRLPSIRQAGIREATGKRCPSHPECPTVGSSRPTSCLRDTNKKFCNP